MPPQRVWRRIPSGDVSGARRRSHEQGPSAVSDHFFASHGLQRVQRRLVGHLSTAAACLGHDVAVRCSRARLPSCLPPLPALEQRAARGLPLRSAAPGERSAVGSAVRRRALRPAPREPPSSLGASFHGRRSRAARERERERRAKGSRLRLVLLHPLSHHLLPLVLALNSSSPSSPASLQRLVRRTAPARSSATRRSLRRLCVRLLRSHPHPKLGRTSV
jgi:hypothetical protein